MKKYANLWYVVVIMFLLVIPFAGMIFWPTQETTENTVLAKWPSFMTEKGINEEYLADMGAYFEDHFAFRQNFVTANALLRGKLLKTGATDQVVVGSDDWLYYAGTLDDYQGKNLFSERELYIVAQNIKMMQEYVESQGSRFILAVAPNKNSLYNANMPYYIQEGGAHNWDLLTEYLDACGVTYVDLHQLFQEEEEVLYFKRDSHWNNKGAVLAYNALMEQMGENHESYLNVPYEVEKVHSGDLDEMLYPLAVDLEEEYQYDKEFHFQYVNEVKDNMDDWIETVQPGEKSSLLMYRDSFGESLLPFMAEEMEHAYFSRLVPYNLTQVEQYHPDYVVVERVERRLSAFAEEAPIMRAPLRENPTSLQAETDSTLHVEKQGGYLMISGKIDKEYIQTETEILVSVRDSATMETKTYQAFGILTEDGEGNGYQLYLEEQAVPMGDIRINVFTKDMKDTMIVKSGDFVRTEEGVQK